MTNPINQHGRAPVVSFLIVTYNQIAHIDAAVEGALAQDYAPLEIVITDDGSTDGTWERLEELAAVNPALVVTQTPHNLGTLGNLYHGVEHTSGDLLVLAAGDDISVPHRVTRIVQEWQNTGADALHSAYSVIDESGRQIADYEVPPQGGSLQKCFPGTCLIKIKGASSAYDRRVFVELDCPQERILAEDLFFTLFLGLYNRNIVNIPEPLVEYREHYGSSTNSAGGVVTDPVEIRCREARAQVVAASMALVFAKALSAVVEQRSAFGRFPIKSVDQSRLRANASHYRYAARWLDTGLMSRLRELSARRSMAQRKWTLARLFGPRGIGLARRFVGRSQQ